jgi:hypothetical protein
MSATDRRPRLRPALALAGIALMSPMLGGCATIGAKPWDHDLLARESMALNTHPHITAFRDHIYFSREGAAGGRTFDGGGCGCN